MCISNQHLREQVLDLVYAAEGGMRISALVTALQQHEGEVMRDLWRILDDLAAEGTIRLEGSLTQRRVVVVQPRRSATPRSPTRAASDPSHDHHRRPSHAPVMPEASSEPEILPPRGKRTTRYRNLTRVDAPDHHMVGYMGRIQWRGQRYQAFFADQHYGDGLGALTAALAWRHATEQAIGKPPSDDPPAARAGKSKYTGMYGVSRINRKQSPYFIATWYEGGKRKTACFAIAKYGEREALRLAREAYARGRSFATEPDDDPFAGLHDYDGT